MKKISALFLLGPFFCLSIGCGSSNSGGGNGGDSGGGSSSKASIIVSISGLPGGTQAAVTVSNTSGFSHPLTSSQTVDVTAGTYTVTAKPVTQTNSIYEPVQVTQTVTASISSSISVQVQYAVLSYKYSAIGYPGTIWTVATGINNAGEIVGYYTDYYGNYHGFTDSGGAFTSFECPTAASSPGSVAETWAYGINDRGQIVGYCMDAYPPYSLQKPGFAEDGYLYDHGNFTVVNYPDAFETFPAAINSQGSIAGLYENDDTNSQGDSQGYYYSGGTYKTIDYAGAQDTEILGINNSGQMSGYSGFLRHYPDCYYNEVRICWREFHRFELWHARSFLERCWPGCWLYTYSLNPVGFIWVNGTQIEHRVSECDRNLRERHQQQRPDCRVLRG